jgi:phage baseplate assembly protein W
MTELASTYTSFQLSAIGVGAIATGISDIRQCINFILCTIPGSDPLRPLFGSDVYKYIDAPVNTMIPNVKKEIFEAIDLWEPRIEVVSITHEISSGQVIFSITYNVIDSSLLDILTWSIGGTVQSGNSTSGIILSALIPAKVEFGRYYVSFIADGKSAYPEVPVYGFSSAQDLLVWISQNWFNYGRWYLTDDKLVLFLNNGIVKKASLSVIEIASITIQVDIPELASGEYFNLSLVLNSIAALPAFPIGQIGSIEVLQRWLLFNWSDYGSWSILNNGVEMTAGDFNNDFNNDFSIGGIHPNLDLVFQTKLFLTAALTFI